LKAETGFEHRHLSTDCSPTVSQRCAGALSPARFVPGGSAAPDRQRRSTCVMCGDTELAATRSLRRRLRPTQKLAERRRSSRSRLAMSQRCSRVQMAVVHFSEMRRGSVACPFCPRRFCRTRPAAAQYLRHVRSHGIGRDSEPEEAAATNSEAGRAAAVEQVASRNESAMQPCADGGRAVTNSAQGLQKPFQCDTCQKNFSEMRRGSVACPFCPRRFCRTRPAAAQYLRHVRSHGIGRDSEPEEAAATNSEAGRAAAVEQVASRNESAMQPCADGGRAVTNSAQGLQKPFQCDTCQKNFSEMRRGSVACPFCPRRFCRTRPAAAQYLRHVRSHGIGRDSEPEEAAATNSEAGRAAAVEQVASRNESAMKPCADGGRAVTNSAQGLQKPFQCDTCQKKFSRRSYLNAHISVVHRKAKPHKCKRCGKSFSAKHDLHVHSRSHTGERPFECKPHSFSEMRRGSVACPFCPRRFCRTRPAAAQYLRHVRSHGIGRDSEPEEAAATNSEAGRAAAVEQVASRNESAMKPCADGGRAVTNSAQGLQKPFQCDTCQKKFSRRSYLNAHISVVHRKAKPHKCKRCGKSFSAKHDLHVHSRSHTGERPFECKVCGKRFSISSSLTTHSRQHTGEKPFECKQSHNALRLHTGEKPFECKVCGKTQFSVSSSLTTHSRQHTGEKPFECKVCGKRFSVSSSLTTHSRQHTGEKPYECKVCGKRFSVSSHLTRHSRLHTGEKPFECKVCGKRFSVSSSLTRHSRQHTGEKLFECKVCGKRFSVSSHLTRHSRLHTGEKPFECKVCGKRFSDSSHLTRHSRLHTRKAI
uniref:Zinc finger protein n=1 Tax=Macrostomum lignano TaxID=282301 RepID=A0A1I8HQT3_9PLAT